jgi:hypothetical protein
MKRILCILGFHRWSKWKIVSIGDEFWEDHLIRRCEKCGEEHHYIGITQIDIQTGSRSPYEFKY